jgi:hypothetical protein
MTSNTVSARNNAFDQLDPDSLENGIAQLVAVYQRSRSTMHAWAVMRCMQALSQHPDYEGSDEERCVYGRLSRQWRWLLQSRCHPAAGAAVTATEAA